MLILNYTNITFTNDSLGNCTGASEIITFTVEWNYCWKAYIFGFIFLFVSLEFYSVAIAIKYRKRLWTKRIVLALICFIISLGNINILYLAIDPHGYYKRVPKFLINVLDKLPYPLTTGGYCLLQTIVVKATRLDIKPIMLNGRKFVTLTTLLYIAVILCLLIAGTIYEQLSKLSLITEGVFILLSIYLCISFLYGAPKLSKYANEVMKASKDLSIQSLSKKLDSVNDQPSSANTPSRLRNPRIKRNVTSGNRISLISCSDSSDSDTVTEKYVSYKRKSSSGSKTKFILPKQSYSNNQLSVNDFPHLLKYIRQPKSSSDDEEMESNIASNSTNLVAIEREDESENEDECHLPLNRITVQCTNNNEPYKQSKSTASLSDNECENDNEPEIVLIPSLLPSNESFIFESGYVADSEQVSNYSHEEFKSYKSSRQSSEDFLDRTRKDSASSFEMGLPSSSSFLSLYRLRQGWMLHYVIRLIYAVTFLITVDIFMKIYIVFSAYGGLFFASKPKPWPWLVFHLAQNSVELASLFIMMGVAHTVIAHKFHRKRIRKRGKSMDLWSH